MVKRFIFKSEDKKEQKRRRLRRSHALSWLVGAVMGFAGGIYALPILVAYNNAEQAKSNLPKTKTVMMDKSNAISDKTYTGTFNPDAKDSDFLHRGWGDITISDGTIKFHENVKLTPGPDYRLYVIPTYTETESEFQAIKAGAIEIAQIKQFDGTQSFPIPDGLDVSGYEAVLIWCEAFKEFITVAKLTEK